MNSYDSFDCHLDFESFHDASYMTIGYHSKGYYFSLEKDSELIIGFSNITRHALLKMLNGILLYVTQKIILSLSRRCPNFKKSGLIHLL